MNEPLRIRQTQGLDAPVETVRFVKGPRGAGLHKLDITTVRDLVTHYPTRYIDLSQVALIERAKLDSYVTVAGTVGQVQTKRPRPRMTIVEASIIDESGVMFATWFNQPWMAKQLIPGTQVAASGKIAFDYGYRRMQSPLIEVLGSKQEEDRETYGKIVPVHALVSEISGAWMRRLIITALEQTSCVLDPLPADLRIAYDFMPRHAAWNKIHFPKSMEEKDEARRRLSYEEVLLLQLFMLSRRRKADMLHKPFSHIVTGPTQKALDAAMPFELTKDQQKARADILADMHRPARMNRMLLGDVGTGKTAVAAYCLAAVHDSCTQAAMMAPTTVLATQYADKLGPLLDEVGVRWALLTGATTPSKRATIMEELATGEIEVLFGTHALIEPDVLFANLTMVIIDEQHRFGVNQRKALAAKSAGADVLSMTATPIPRTLALLYFGDLECTYLMQRPQARKPAKTKVISRKRIADAYEDIRNAVAAGQQAFIVCPLVGNKDDDEWVSWELDRGDDLADIVAATKERDYLASKVFPDMEVGLLTGKMASAEKLAVMEAFRAGRVQVLVATTVIEVGVDVPAATVMIIENADRFGLSQLHQLRGRVGRGSVQGTVYLVSDSKDDDAKARLKALATIDDGFELASSDLAMRHEGDLLGKRQSGKAATKLVDVVKDYELIVRANEDAHAIMDVDPALEFAQHKGLKAEVEALAAKAEEE